METVRPSQVPALKAEECLVKMIIASALREITEPRRVGRWIDNIKSARDAKLGRRFALAESAVEEDAHRSAADAAKIIGLGIAAQRQAGAVKRPPPLRPATTAGSPKIA